MSRWASQSSKLVAGRAERAAVGSTPILSRQINCQLSIANENYQQKPI